MPFPLEKKTYSHNVCYMTQQSLFSQSISCYDGMILMFEINYKYKSFQLQNIRTAASDRFYF